MPVSPELGTRLSTTIDAMAADFQAHVTRRVADLVEAHIQAPDRMLLELANLRQAIRRDQVALMAAATAEIRAILRKAYRAGANAADTDLTAAGVGA